MEYNVGDRVRIYGTIQCEVAGPGHYTYKRGELGTVKFVWEGKDELLVTTRFGETAAHPKQCRKLKSKKPREWRLKYSDGAKQWVECRCRSAAAENSIPGTHECLLVREVTQKRKT